MEINEDSAYISDETGTIIRTHSRSGCVIVESDLPSKETIKFPIGGILGVHAKMKLIGKEVRISRLRETGQPIAMKIIDGRTT